MVNLETFIKRIKFNTIFLLPSITFIHFITLVQTLSPFWLQINSMVNKWSENFIKLVLYTTQPNTCVSKCCGVFVISLLVVLIVVTLPPSTAHHWLSMGLSLMSPASQLAQWCSFEPKLALDVWFWKNFNLLEAMGKVGQSMISWNLCFEICFFL